jgi:hypothetical protein
MLAKIEFHEIDSWNLVVGTSEMYATVIQRICGSILDYASVCYSEMAKTHFLKLKGLQYRGLKIVLG